MSQPYPYPPSGPPPPRRWPRRHPIWTSLLGVIGAFVVLIVVIAIVQGPQPTQTAASPTSDVTSSVAASTSASPSTTTPPTRTSPSTVATTSAIPSTVARTTTVATTTKPPPTTTKPAPVHTTTVAPPTTTPPPTTTAPPKPVVYSGTSDDVVTVHKPAGPILMTATYTGGNNFAVQTPDSSQLLVNTIGAYHGTSILDPSGESTPRLQVSASGPWKIELNPLTSAVHYTGGAYHGAGDQVLAVLSGSLSTATFGSAATQANFAVTEYTADGMQNLLVNVVAPPAYRGTVPLSPPSFLAVTAVGDWTLTTG